ncbi:MAG: hypothetical protein QOF83_2210 [Solirubrobacteraceae bacterium]|nr:hypothetical protein [Solirubrobacteraceae bacterium]
MRRTSLHHVPSFCRHNRLIQNCPICAREQDLELRPVVSPAGQSPRTSSHSPIRPPRRPGTQGGSRTAGRRSGPGVKVRHLARGADDGYRSELAPGLRSSEDAVRLAEEVAFAAARLDQLAIEPPGLYAEVADPAGETEERTWLAFLIALLGPTEDDDPFAAIALARTTWASGQPPSLEAAQAGPRGAYEPATAARTVAGYRTWAARSGSQEAAFNGEPSWSPERRFARVFERLALPGFARGARFELLSTLGRTGVYEVRAGALALGGSDDVTVAAKRLLGIGDPMLLERRAANLAEACGVEMEALDLGFYNWERGVRARVGMKAGLEPDPVVRVAVEDALGL